jgi:hypothetical protein
VAGGEKRVLRLQGCLEGTLILSISRAFLS